MVLEKTSLANVGNIVYFVSLAKNSIELIILFFLSDITCDTDATITGLYL